MARRLAAKGHDVQVIAADRKSQHDEREQVEGLTIHWIPVPYAQSMPYKDRIKSFVTFAVKASLIARRLQGDIALATSTPLTVAIPGIAATIFRRQSLVFEVRDLWPDAPIVMGALSNKLVQKLAFALEKFTYRYSGHIVALSPDMKKGIVSKGIAEEKVTIIPNASDIDLFENQEENGRNFRKNQDWLGDRKLVLYCGTLGRVNDVSYIARLASSVGQLDPSIRFLVVGEGSDETQVRDAAKSLGVFEKNFFMMGQVPKPEVPAFFAAADLSISTVAPKPLLSANSANKVFDTFASGTPLAVNHGGWLADLIKETNSGLVLDPFDTEQAAKELVEFLHSDSRKQTAAENSKQLAITNFDRDKLAEKLNRVLKKTYDKTRIGDSSFPFKKKAKN